MLVKNVLNNINHGIKDIAIFEITKVFRDRGEGRLPEEKTVLGVMLSGRETLKGWDSMEKSYDYYSLKKILEHIFNLFYKDSSLSLDSERIRIFPSSDKYGCFDKQSQNWHCRKNPPVNC